MRKKVLIPIVASIVLGGVSIFNSPNENFGNSYIYAEENEDMGLSTQISESKITPKSVETVIEESITFTEDEINLISLVTMAEAEGECEKGKRLVIDTILNRVDSEYFPNTVHDVIYQRNQFSCMWNGRINRCCVKEDIRKLVKEEMKARMNYDVMFFNSIGYCPYGQPLFKVGNHYFSKYVK